MEKLYLPQDFTGVFPKEEYSYKEISLTSFAVGFSANKQIEMELGLQYKDQLNANLTAISWIEDNYGYYDGETDDQPRFDKIVKVCTLYLDRGGFIVDGFYRTLQYNGKIVRPSENMPSDARLETKIRDEYNITRLFKSKGMELHKEIFVDKVIKIEGFEDFSINPRSIFFNIIKEVSIFNRCCDMNYIYAIAHEEKETLEKVKKYIGFAALPFAISGGAFVKALQTSIGLVSYLCDIDSTFHLSDKLFEYKGPVIVSDVFLKFWTNKSYRNEQGDLDWWKPTKDPMRNNTSNGSKHDAIEKFKKLSNT
ncbi:hypothetical protein IX39_00215 [Chryseobacterium formosense]|uniref:Uncharacterized protein n=1 Tax=Chryseobacterium formosense TaxID=236814 RepID=A0A085Z3Z0_9FLAO|nr:hypothetical protein [Chryseobacterium formosense]KFE99153.1 hypothetical protein IX39_00215 [Chryseobacterium formosense]